LAWPVHLKGQQATRSVFGERSINIIGPRRTAIDVNFYTHRSRKLCELEVVMSGAEYAKMARGVAYALHPANARKGYQWAVRDGLMLTRD
jgi:hypothetical protein